MFTIGNTYSLQLKREQENCGYPIEILAPRLGITPEELENIESNVTDNSEINEVLKSKIHLFMDGKLDTKLDVIFDWVSITFQTLDYHRIIDEVLQINFDSMEQITSGLNNYHGYFALDGIKVFYHFDNKKMGTNICFSGEGCREFEYLMKHQKRTWYDFFKLCLAYSGRAARIDVAVNDYVRMLDIKELYRKHEKDELKTYFHRISPVFDENITTKESEEITLYFGSRKSDFFMRFYEKDLEIAKKRNVPVEICPIKSRYEVILEGEKARNLLRLYVQSNNIEELIFGVFNYHLKFLDSEKDVPKEMWKVNDKWAEFIGEAQSMKLTVSPQKSSYHRTLSWLAKRKVFVIKREN